MLRPARDWLGSPKRNHRQTKRGFEDRAELITVRLANMCARMGVAAPYGANAAQLQLGPAHAAVAPAARRPTRADRARHPGLTGASTSSTTS